jgi:hypothetical protein
MIKRLLFSLLIFLAVPCFSQIKIDKAGDGWDLKVDSAIQLIKRVDIDKYKLLETNCSQVSFMISSYSSCQIEDGLGHIYIAVDDIKLNSINNIAVVLVHESLHLYIAKKGIELIPAKEETFCYMYELNFIEKLTNPEPWLIEHALNNINK